MTGSEVLSDEPRLHNLGGDVMAYAKIVHQFPDETVIVCEVGCEVEHPDALDELVKRCRDLYADAVPVEGGD